MIFAKFLGKTDFWSTKKFKIKWIKKNRVKIGWSDWMT